MTEVAGIGFSRSVNDNVVTSFSAGYTNVEIEGGAGSDFNGMSYEVVGNWRLTDQMQLNVTGDRRPFQSFFLNNNYYINHSLSARLIHQIGSRTYWQATLRYQINDYPEAVDTGDVLGDRWLPSEGVKRHDDSGEAEIGVSYRFSSSMRMFLGYNYRARRSNILACLEDPSLGDSGACEGTIISPFDFTEDRIVFRVEAGWL